MTHTFSIKTVQPQFGYLPIIDICSFKNNNDTIKHTPTSISSDSNQSTIKNNTDKFKPICLSRFSDTSSDTSTHMGVVYADLNTQHNFVGLSQPIHIKHNDVRKNISVNTVSLPASSQHYFNTKSLLHRCIQWLDHVSGKKIIWRSLNRSGTLALIIPHRGIYFVQFVPCHTTQNQLQAQFESDIQPIPVHIFQTFDDFVSFVQGVIRYDA